MIHQVVVGKSYEARNGEIYTIHGMDAPPFENYPYYDEIKKQSWNYRGVWALGKKTEYDLIREAEKVEEKQELKLEVGKTYRTKEGKEIEIILHQKQHPDDLHPFLGGNGRWYTNDGQLHLNDLIGDHYDLIEEIETKEEKVEEKQELKLEVGKTYRSRDGEEVKIVMYTPHKSFPFLGDDGCDYRENGSYCRVESILDLIEEVKEEKVEEIKEEKQELKLEVGKTYRARNGDTTKIVKRAPNDKTYPFIDRNGWSFMENGRYYSVNEGQHDLIEEIKEKKMEKVITPEEYLKQFKQITEKMYEITKAKNSDYTADCGDALANFKVVEDLGVCSVETGFLTRMSDKVARLAGLAKGKEIQVKDEKYEDTLLDLANYSILLAIYLKNKR